MNLKNRFAAIATVAAIAIPAVAFAAKWNRDTGKASTVTVKVKAMKGAVKFDATARNNAIIIEERGDATIVKVDGRLMTTGEEKGEMTDRDAHMKEMVFKKHQFVEIVAENKDIDAAKSSKKLPIKVKFGSSQANKVIEDFKLKDGIASGTFKITTGELGLGKVCKPIGVGFVKFSEVCVVEQLEVSAAIAVKN